MKMQQAMLNCNGVQTHVITEGRWVEEGLAPNGHKDVVLVIPGNPGIPSFYNGFIKALKSRLPTETPVWIMAHAGHVLPPKQLCFASDEDSNNELYNLKGQTEHKRAFVNEYIPKDARIHLVGHSIGAWFILKLLEDEELAKRVVKCYLLFPTIEHMADTQNGKFVINYSLRYASIICFLAWIFTFFPTFIQEFLVRIFGKVYLGYGSESVKTIVQLIHPTVLERIFLLAKDEMDHVKEMNHEIIDKNSDKLWLYYGATDGWTPKRYYHQFREKHPEVKAELCNRGFRHAFVLSHDKDVGNMVGDLINENIN